MGTSKGRSKYIETPEKLWELFLSYLNWVEQTPRKENRTTVKGDIVEVKLQRPLTFVSFERWLFENEIINDLGDYESNKNDAYKKYSTIITRIKKFISSDQIEGGMVGQYNSNLTARLNGLHEHNKLDADVNVKKTTNVIKFGDTEVEI